jgi:endonuclease III
MADEYLSIRDKLIDLSKNGDSEELFPTLHPDASKLVHSNPYAFCVATCLDRGTKAEIIWTMPYWITQITGHFDPNRFYELPIEEITSIFLRLPKKPRYINAAPYTFLSITKKIVEEYAAEANQIWENKKAIDVKRTFMNVYGVGNGIANMAVLLIEKMYKIKFSDLDHSRMDIKPDVHTMRVLYRLGVSAGIQEDEAISAARFLNPAFPGEIDGALWLLGRKWCAATTPDCGQCPMLEVCPRIDL